MKKHYNNIALIVAGGSGSRFGSDIPKQYAHIRNSPVLRIVVEKFIAHEDIDAVIVAINEDHLDLYKKAVEGIEILPYSVAGRLRQDTVRYALEEIQKYSPKNILIHDAVRILVEDKTITELLESLNYYQAAIAATPVNDTIKYSSDGMTITKTISREGMFMAQTPQAFDYKTILSLHHKYKGHSFTDDSLICEQEGIKVRLVEASARNFKITTKQDLIIAEKIMEGKNGR